MSFPDSDFLFCKFFRKLCNVALSQQVSCSVNMADDVHFLEAQLQCSLAWCANMICVDGNIFMSSKVRPLHQWVELPYKHHNGCQMSIVLLTYWRFHAMARMQTASILKTFTFSTWVTTPTGHAMKLFWDQIPLLLKNTLFLGGWYFCVYGVSLPFMFYLFPNLYGVRNLFPTDGSCCTRQTSTLCPQGSNP